MPVESLAENRMHAELDCSTECHKNSVHRGFGRVKKPSRNVEAARDQQQWEAALIHRQKGQRCPVVQ